MRTDRFWWIGGVRLGATVGFAVWMKNGGGVILSTMFLVLIPLLELIPRGADGVNPAKIRVADAYATAGMIVTLTAWSRYGVDSCDAKAIVLAIFAMIPWIVRYYFGKCHEPTSKR